MVDILKTFKSHSCGISCLSVLGDGTFYRDLTITPLSNGPQVFFEWENTKKRKELVQKPNGAPIRVPTILSKDSFVQRA